MTTWQHAVIVSNVLNTDTLTTERRKVLDMHQAGWTVRDMAKALDVSTQRIYQQLKALGLSGRANNNQAVNE